MSCHGTYKGQRFRSLLELSFMIHMEGFGYVLGDTLLYEKLRVPYTVGRSSKERQYIIDFYAPSDGIAWEVKPRKRCWNKRNTAKFWAATKRLTDVGITYKVVTEDDIPRIFSRAEAEKNPLVELRKKRRRR